MNNRYNELTEQQQKLFDRMINSVASHRDTIADDLTARTWWSFRQTEAQLREGVQESEDAKATSCRESKTDTTPVAFERQGA